MDKYEEIIRRIIFMIFVICILIRMYNDSK